MSAESISDSSAASQFAYWAPTYFPVPFHLQNASGMVQQPADQHYAPAVSLPAVPPPPVAPVYPAVYTFPSYQQAQQLFEKDAQTITPEALASVKAAIASSEIEHKAETKKKAIPRKAAGQTWEDPTLADWPESGARI